MSKTHSLHIPVMGIGFTIDTPIKVSSFGISSAISLVDDMLIEKIRKMYCNKYKIKYEEISEKIEDSRAKRIKSYLNLVNKLAEEKFEELKNTTLEKTSGIREYLNLLPENSTLKQEFENIKTKFGLTEASNWIKNKLSMGSIDVNIMTKVDKEHYDENGKLPPEFNDAHSALRGFATSDLNSSIIFSAGLNSHLYKYLENFEDFYPNKFGELKKKIVLKVSDYRSALIQGKILAKKGLWVSEFRVESGLNCGGHAFASDGHLLGPILSEFKNKKNELQPYLKSILDKALTKKERDIPKIELPLKITAQGGVGTSEEHNFLLEHYKVDSVGWGTPFLLVPEVVNVDEDTLEKLEAAKEDDLYLSNISPLNVPFNSLRNNTKDLEKKHQIEIGNPGSNCPKKYVRLDKEFSEKGMCTASRQYQSLKIKQLKEANLSPEEYQKRYDKIVDKSCICVGLGTSSLIVNNLNTEVEGTGVSVCPGPNLAYFSKRMTLKEITDHIYGRANLISRNDRPNMFVKELDIYYHYLVNKFEEVQDNLTEKEIKYYLNFIENLEKGTAYYFELFSNIRGFFEDSKERILSDLESHNQKLSQLKFKINNLKFT